MWKIPLSDISFDEREIEAVTRVLRSQWLTMGEVTQDFERAFAEYTGVRHAFAVSNCTAALQLAYRVLGVTPGDEIIMPSLTFVATANAAVVEGAVPVFADVNSENDLTVSPGDILAKITTRTRAVTVVHYGGYPCNMDAIMQIAQEHNLRIIEDCAHSPGATFQDQQTPRNGESGFSMITRKFGDAVRSKTDTAIGNAGTIMRNCQGCGQRPASVPRPPSSASREERASP